jgi:hypothetical protein
MSVRGRGDHGFGSDGAGGTGPVLNDDRLAKRRRHSLGERAYDDLVRAAGRRRYDQPDQLSGIGGLPQSTSDARCEKHGCD